MSQLSQRPISKNLARRASVALAAALLFAPVALYAQSVSITSDSSKTSDRWLHVRVVSTESKNETVRVNVPLDMAEKVLPAINKDRLHNGKVRFNDTDMNGAKSTEKSRVDVKIPMKVVDALFSAGKDELDLVAALRALSAHGDTELVSVKSDENTVRVWLDSKNISD